MKNKIRMILGFLNIIKWFMVAVIVMGYFLNPTENGRLFVLLIIPTVIEMMTITFLFSDLS